MITSIVLASLMPGGLIGLLFFVAIAVVVAWAIWELIKWLGVPIPRPVQIVLIAIVCIICIVLLFRALGYAM